MKKYLFLIMIVFLSTISTLGLGQNAEASILPNKIPTNLQGSWYHGKRVIKNTKKRLTHNGHLMLQGEKIKLSFGKNKIKHLIEYYPGQFGQYPIQIPYKMKIKNKMQNVILVDHATSTFNVYTRHKTKKPINIKAKILY